FISLFVFVGLIVKAQVCLKPTTYNSGTPYFTSADFNNDGKLDLAIGHTDSVRVMLGDGLGGFTWGSLKITFFTSYIGNMISADLNKDGNADIAFAYGTSNVEVLLGTGTGTFGNPFLLPVGNNPWSLVSNDFNADGNPDIAVTNGGSSTISVLLGDGLGNFSAHVDFNSGLNQSELIAQDFNGDGKVDLAVGTNIGNGQGGKIALLLGDGLGGFGSPSTFVTDGNDPYSLCVADFNSDGFFDIATANSNSNNVTVLLGTAGGSFSTAVSYFLNLQCISILARDFDGDGKLDLAVGNENSNYVSVLLGNGSGSFGVATNFPDAYVPQKILSEDFNSDGKPDLAVGNQQGNNFMIFLNVLA
ncbi:MAG: FG-GAP repeat domain-containing protein, partial [Candidatus Paceibacterales bacterium]